MFSQVQQALDCLTAALGGVEAAATGDLRRALGLAKQLRARVELLETKAASVVAQRECHGDGGAGLLNQVGGRSRSEAVRNVRAEAELAELPEARSAVSEGEISLANAAKLAQAARKTSPDAVQGDPDLVHMAKTLPPDEFAQAAQRWTIRHQSAEDLAAQHRRNRRNRSVQFWNGEDGSVQMRGSFDAEMGARIQQRLRQQAEQLRQADRRRQAQSQSPDAATDAGEHHDGDNVASTKPGNAERTRDQRMADALDTLLATSAEPASGPRPTPPAVTKAGEIIVRADLAAVVGAPGGIAEICGVGPIPPSTLQRLACNSDVSVEIFGDNLTPLYETVASRAPTAAQRRALIARDGACIGCGEPPGECEAHHITPCQRGGKTRLDNLVLVCWRCHDLIHDHNWQVTIRDGRYRLAPPDPAHPAEPAPQRKPNRQTPQHLLEKYTTQAEACGQVPQPKPERRSPQREPEQPTPQLRSGQRAPTIARPSPSPVTAKPLWHDPVA
ncbi:HNH endonuclease [Candidatus Poriferisodalis sp.]|uniref:HNH endonuclease signature motif containing protein n=1 Tax=Candidatus Poriferisodalis sp. TaxID=3101277 RepID=UPI003B01A179